MQDLQHFEHLLCKVLILLLEILKATLVRLNTLEAFVHLPEEIHHSPFIYAHPVQGEQVEQPAVPSCGPTPHKRS